jgi:hypothetical protein
VDELTDDRKKYHFTNDPGYKEARKKINDVFGMEGLSYLGVMGSLEKAEREALRTEALRILWENGVKEAGKRVNHVELANRLVDRQLERIGKKIGIDGQFRKALEMPISKGKETTKRSTSTSTSLKDEKKKRGR